MKRQHDVGQTALREKKKRNEHGGETGMTAGVKTMRIGSNETVKTQSGLAGIVNNNDMELI